MHRPENMQTEIQVWGRTWHSPIPLDALPHGAIACVKIAANLASEHYPDGLALKTREHSDFLTINGIQTQSAHCL